MTRAHSGTPAKARHACGHLRTALMVVTTRGPVSGRFPLRDDFTLVA